MADNNDRTALMRAADNGHTETAKLLLNNKADVNAKDNENRTALMWAAWRGNTKTVKLLRRVLSKKNLRLNTPFR